MFWYGCTLLRASYRSKINMSAPHQKLDLKIKTSLSHLKMLAKLTEICFKWYGCTLLRASYQDKINTWAPHQKLDLNIKTSHSHLKILAKLTEICFKCFDMVWHYYVQVVRVRSTRESRIKSWTLKLKHRVHTLKF